MSAQFEVVLAQARAYYEKNQSGGSLHVVLDDGNTDRDNCQFCYNWANEHDDGEGMLLAEALMELSQKERDEIYRTLHGFDDE